MSEPTDIFALYFSHSWRPRDVELNRLVWKEIAETCELLVDVPQEAGANPPYYINRIEELLRRSDLFLCVLTERNSPTGNGEGDEKLLCSAYSLFEIRLAERFDIPRFVLYERGTRFKAPPSQRPSSVYIAFDRGKEELPDGRYWRTSIAPRIRQWADWVAEYRKPISPELYTLAVSLFPPQAPNAHSVGVQLKQALRDAGYEQVSLRAAYRNNIELFQLLRVAGLVVTEWGVEDTMVSQLGTVAHALCVPTIRMLHGNLELPWLLQGHPGGYQQDIVYWTTPEDLPALIQPRASAMFRISHALSGEEADQYFQSKRYAQDFVFISHTLKPPHRELVERIYELLAQYYVHPFEYHMVNTAGTDWKNELDEQLRKTTHFVALLTDGYELSEVCTYELEEILKRGSDVTILPFMAKGRSIPHPKLRHLHHRLLASIDPLEAAKEVVQQIMAALGDS